MKKYDLDRIEPTFYKGVGWVFILIGLIAGIGVMMMDDFISGFTVIVLSTLCGLIYIAIVKNLYIEEDTLQTSAKINKNENVTTYELTDSEKSIAESSLKKLSLNGYRLIGFDGGKSCWKLQSIKNSVEFEVNYNQLIELSNNF
jgi:hypothetical protein